MQYPFPNKTGSQKIYFEIEIQYMKISMEVKKYCMFRVDMYTLASIFDIADVEQEDYHLKNVSGVVSKQYLVISPETNYAVLPLRSSY